jgi:Fe2+ or Zn2+ uptake regulation protein
MSDARPDALAETVTDRLRRSGARVTANRMQLAAILESAGRPLTIPEILETRRGLAQSSVYRNLVVLEDAGVVHRIVTNAEFARYELAEDLTGHHHHLICVQCGSVQDVPASAGLERSLKTAIEQVRRRSGFRTRGHRVDLVGLCKNCAEVA